MVLVVLLMVNWYDEQDGSHLPDGRIYIPTLLQTDFFRLVARQATGQRDELTSLATIVTLYLLALFPALRSALVSPIATPVASGKFSC